MTKKRVPRRAFVEPPFLEKAMRLSSPNSQKYSHVAQLFVIRKFTAKLADFEAL
jgi:hypothetical protein